MYKVFLIGLAGAVLGIALLSADPATKPAATPASAPAQTRPAGIAYGQPRRLCNLADERIDESSGLAASHRRPGLFWTHNDSGDGARLYAVNAAGRCLAVCTLRGVRATDWEDMASFTLKGRCFLLAADVGDNAQRRKTCRLYVLGEPKVPGGGRTASLTATASVTIEFKYEDGPHDCESVAVDARNRKIYLVSKTVLAKVYELPLPTRSPDGVLVAKAVAALPVPFAVAMDIAPDNTRAVVLTYGAAQEFTRAAGETWAQAFARAPRKLDMPSRRQGESICYGTDGKTLYLTSEKLPTPLYRVAPKSPE